MASTNKTTHYNLSQYSANDKPTYLVDYNSDMSNIDTGIYNAQSKANTNESAIGTLSNLNTTVKTDLVSAINEVEGKTDYIGNLSNLTTSANTDLVVAINEVDAEADLNNQNIGTMVNLETTVKTSLVGAINEINTKANNNLSNIGDLNNLDTSVKTNLVSAINQLLQEIEGTILWTNPNPSTAMSDTTLNVDTTNYDEIMIIYRQYNSSDQLIDYKFEKSINSNINLNYSEVGSDYWVIRSRRLTITSNNTIHVENGYQVANSSLSSSNFVCIPEYIIGYNYNPLAI